MTVLTTMQNFAELFSTMAFTDIVDILLLAVMFQCMFLVAKKYNSSYLIIAVTLMLLLGFVVVFFDVTIVSLFVRWFLICLPLFFVIIFRSELKREIWKKSRQERAGEIAVSKFSGSERDIHSCIQTIIKAVQSMSKKNVGALIVVIPSIIPMQIAESGVFLNGDLSTEIIENIFTPNTPLHDGAMLITGNKILAAGCFLPLTQDTSLPKDLGTRHRAGIGITEMADVLSLIVSEETGVISFVRRGTIERYADAEMLSDALEKIYGIKE